MQTHQIYALHITKWLTTAALALWMSIPGAVLTLTGFVIADFVTGIAAAFVQRRVDSSVALRGFVKKAMIIGLVMALHAAEKAFGQELGIEKWLSAYFIFIEVISIVENCARVGIPIPAPLVEALVKLKQLQPRSMTPAEVEKAFGEENGK